MSSTVLQPLSKRERQGAELLYGGATTTDIVDKLSITENTVRNHIKSIYRKLDVRTRGQLFVTLRGA
jgi:DNA-binding CsgD family transcriptional regulator